MRVMGKGLVAIIVMAAFASSTASAIEVSEAPEHCPEVRVGADHAVSGGCSFELETEAEDPVELRQHATMGGEVLFSVCAQALVANIHSEGDGFIYEQQLVGAECGVKPCDEAEPSHVNNPWPVSLVEFGGRQELQMTICVRPATVDEGAQWVSCTINALWSDDGDREYELRTAPFGGHEPGLWASRCSQDSQLSLSGHWVVHGRPILISH